MCRNLFAFSDMCLLDFCNIELSLLESRVVNALLDVGRGTRETELWQPLQFFPEVVGLESCLYF